MAIVPLPPSITRLLGSSVAIVDPVSLVKELVDNSIDADATTVEVLVSQNAVDKIQVGDNGRGIDFEDHELLGRRACTSKLRTFDELETRRGGETLGFRGEALAGDTSLATVKITTRTARDPVATLIWLRRGVGGVETSRPVSAPVGTTVQALQLFKELPVRRRNAMKANRKSLGSIKRLLETYALAMPRLKLTFKVIGDQNHAWSYSPLSSMSPREAVTQVFGNLTMAQCVEDSVPLVSEPADGSPGPTWGSLAAILPRSDCHLAPIKDKGSFISVDSRPILSTRGIGKKLATILKKSLARSLGENSVATPFMRLSISCNPGSYDANISPLKDEVIFKDEQAIVDCFRELCDGVYGQESTNPDKDGNSPPASQLGETNTPSYEISRLEAHVPSRANAQASLHEDSWIDLENEMFVDDEELSTILDEAAAYETSAGSKRCSEGCRTTDQGSAQTQSSAEKPNETGNPATVTMMRTVHHVNLSRKESNESDQGSTTGLVPVHVAPRRTASPASGHATSGPDGKDPWPAGRRGTIRQYFRRARDQPIEIAVDETATSGNSQSPEGSNQCETTRQREIGRPPLMELSESDLNAMRDDEGPEWSSETEDGFSGSEPDGPNAPRGDLDPPLGRREQAGMAGPRGPAPARGFAADLALAGNAVGRTIRRGGGQTPRHALPVDDFDIPRTPPPSNTLWPERISGFGRQGLSGLGLPEGGGTQALSRWRGVSRGDHQGKTSVTTRDGALRNGPRYRLSGSEVFSLEGGSLARSSDEELRRPSRRIYNTTGAEYSRHTPSSIEDLLERSCRPDMETPADQLSAPSSPSSQVMLRTPPQPSGSSLSNESHDDGFQIGSTPRIDYAPSSRQASERPRKRQRSEIFTREDEDPRGYYMEKKGLRTKSGRRQRLPSRMLPLERIPARDETRRLTATIRGGLSVLPQENVAMVGEIDSPLVFRDMEEASSVEGRLRMAVRLWLDGDKETLVEYTMRLAAKGKQQE